MSRIRGQNTKPETILRKALWCCGYRYRISNKLPGRPDIVFPGRKVVVFVDGCFWHMCPSHFTMPKKNRTFWEAKLKRNVARDHEVNNALDKQGWKVIRVWEHEIRDDLDCCVASVERALQK